MILLVCEKILVRLALKPPLHSLTNSRAGLRLVPKEDLHPKHRLMNYHQFFLDHIRPTDRVLDIGCGNGALAYDLAGKTAHVTGIDL